MYIYFALDFVWPLQLAVRPAPGPLRLGARLQAMHDGAWWAATVVGITGPPPAVAAVAGTAGAPMEGAQRAFGLVCCAVSRHFVPVFWYMHVSTSGRNA